MGIQYIYTDQCVLYNNRERLDTDVHDARAHVFFHCKHIFTLILQKTTIPQGGITILCLHPWRHLDDTFGSYLST